MLGEDLEQRSADAVEQRVVVEGRTAGRIGPRRADLRGHEPVRGLRQGGETVARKSDERGFRGLEHSQVLQAGANPRLPSPGFGLGEPRERGVTHERIASGAGRHGDRLPCVLAGGDGGEVHLLESEEMLGERSGKALDRPVEVILGERVGRVLHRVRRDDERVVALDVGRLEGALQADRDSQVPDLVTVRPPDHLDQPDCRLAVAVRTELDHRVSSPAPRIRR